MPNRNFYINILLDLTQKVAFMSPRGALVSSASLPVSTNDLVKRHSGYLRSYTTHSNGFLVLESNGDFTFSCKDFKVSGSWFTARCLDEEGKEKNNVNTSMFLLNL